MSLDSDVNLLARLSVFADLSQDHLRLLAFSAVRREVKKGAVLFEKDEAADGGYVIASGVIDFIDDSEGEPRVVASCDSGSLIGELALFVETKRPAKAVAAMECDLIELNRALVTRMLNEYPDAATRIRETLTARLQSTIGELGPIQGRLAEIGRIGRRRH